MQESAVGAARLVDDPWLRSVAGIPCFRLEIDPGGAEAICANLRELLPRGRTFVYAKVPTGSTGIVADLTAAGFALVDTNIVLERETSRAVAARRGEGIVTAYADPGDCAAAQSIAATCFRYSRFHLDPNFPRVTANAVKREWVRSYCEGKRGAALLVAKCDSQTAGFLAVLIDKGAARTAAVIDLIGVATVWQQRGVGEALLTRFMIDWQHRADRFRVGTQLANKPSLQLYQKFDFAVVDSVYVFHGHFHDGVPSR